MNQVHSHPVHILGDNIQKNIKINSPAETILPTQHHKDEFIFIFT